MNGTIWALFVGGGWIAGWLLCWKLPRLARRPGPRTPDYDVVIPARNEAPHIEHLVRDLLAQWHPPAAVIVVDDESTDSTAALAERAGATVVRSGGPPPGWVGKTWACQQGSLRCTSSVVVFLDADVRVRPDGMATVVDEVARHGGMVSVAPWHEVERPYEWLSSVFGIVSVMGTGFASLFPARVRAAFGPCIAVERETYERIGGHGAVRAEVVDDVALARVATAEGVPVRIVGGRPFLTYRMYPNGIRQLVEGWSKNIATGARFTPPARSFLVFLWVAGALSAAAGLAAPTVLSVCVYLAWTVQFGRLLRQTGSFPPAIAAVYPLLIVFFVAIFARSLALTAIRGQVQWRGRTISTRSHATGTPAR